ncbi:class I SAM-dependent methyltransferase [candidate division WWE3 bacterium]|nr:class I SAM-dependent methyltransferase [candidate division WWE3 bacterium]
MNDSTHPEKITDRYLRRLRFDQSIRYLTDKKIGTIVDIGCGSVGYYLNYLIDKRYSVNEYIGIDPLLNPDIDQLHQPIKNTRFISSMLDSTLELESNSADLVVGFSVLEHIQYPDKIMKEVIRIMKPGGRAIFSAPTPSAKSILEIMANQLQLISPHTVKRQPQYFTKETMLRLIPPQLTEEVVIMHHYFEFGLNNLFVLYKK